MFLANILCVHVRKSDEMYASPTCCTLAKKKKKKKNATEGTVHVSGIQVTLCSGPGLDRAGPPRCSPLFLPKKSSHKFAVVL